MAEKGAENNEEKEAENCSDLHHKRPGIFKWSLMVRSVVGKGCLSNIPP
jgi:hypothetical protein